MIRNPRMAAFLSSVWLKNSDTVENDPIASNVERERMKERADTLSRERRAGRRSTMLSIASETAADSSSVRFEEYFHLFAQMKAPLNALLTSPKVECCFSTCPFFYQDLREINQNLDLIQELCR